MAKFQPGDVVYAAFPFEESNETKTRPAVIVDVFHDSTFTCMITGTDKRAYCKGLWVLKDSEAGRAMSLTKDSFINAERAVPLKNYMIIGIIGYCPLLEKLEKLIQ